jgi:hypothetical protein
MAPFVASDPGFRRRGRPPNPALTPQPYPRVKCTPLYAPRSGTVYAFNTFPWPYLYDDDCRTPDLRRSRTPVGTDTQQLNRSSGTDLDLDLGRKLGLDVAETAAGVLISTSLRGGFIRPDPISTLHHCVSLSASPTGEW